MMSEITIHEININDTHYTGVWELREEILRKPLGLSLRNEDLSRDVEDIILAAVADNKVVGCLMLHTKNKEVLQLRQMAVAAERQKDGIGRKLVITAEETATRLGYNKLILHAREVAIGFYLRLGYIITSDIFTEVGIPHVVMEKTV